MRASSRSSEEEPRPQSDSRPGRHTDRRAGMPADTSRVGRSLDAKVRPQLRAIRVARRRRPSLPVAASRGTARTANGEGVFFAARRAELRYTAIMMTGRSPGRYSRESVTAHQVDSEAPPTRTRSDGPLRNKLQVGGNAPPRRLCSTL